jgi:hypothetical protein
MVNRLIPYVFLCVLSICAAQGESLDEYQVKAAFLYSFAKFVEWPIVAFKGPSEPIAICVLGQNPFGNALESMVKGKVVNGRAFTVTRLSDPKQTGACQIVFVCSSEQRRVRSILDLLETNSAVTVGEVEGFAAAGGVANFKLDSGRVRIEINAEAASRKNLRISSRLLSLAQIVK